MTETTRQETEAPEDQPVNEPTQDTAAEEEPSGEAEPGAAELEAELADHKDRLLRALAELENMRRRHTRELDEARKYAATGFARELLDVADNLSRALASAPEGEEASEAVRKLVEGVAMTERTLLSAFERQQIVKFAPERGERFDHNRHQAMFEVPTADHAPGTVAEVMQPGYTIADRLLRPALVGVAKALPPSEPREDNQPRRGEQIDTTV